MKERRLKSAVAAVMSALFCGCIRHTMLRTVFFILLWTLVLGAAAAVGQTESMVLALALVVTNVLRGVDLGKARRLDEENDVLRSIPQDLLELLKATSDRKEPPVKFDRKTAN